jgi:hypothetical protein
MGFRYPPGFYDEVALSALEKAIAVLSSGRVIGDLPLKRCSWITHRLERLGAITTI